MKTRLWYLTIAVLLWPLWPGSARAQSLILVPSQSTLQQAITNVTEGGVIEIAAGTYVAPTNGFQMVNLAKRFTIRAATGANVILSGGGTREVVRFHNPSLAAGRPITFERLTFANGVSTADNVAGGVSMVEADGTFITCTFQNNVANTTNGGGGAMLAQASRVMLIDSVFTGNSARRYAGALGVGNDSRVAMHNTRFTNNRVNLPNHHTGSLGGAIWVLNSNLRITNSRFEGNQTGFAGGAIYAFGNWTPPLSTARTDVLVANSTFVDNVAQRDPSVAISGPVLGGAIQTEDHVALRLYNTRFVTNRANQGGAINNYRGLTEIFGGVFQGNQATGNGTYDGFGGALFTVSDDQDPADPNNRPSAVIRVRDTLFQGRFGAVTNTGRFGGCVFAQGDGARAFGTGTIPQNGTIASNRAIVDIQDSLFYNCAVQENAGGGYGGGMMTQMVDLAVRDSLFIGCDALPAAANSGNGGALATFDNSTTSLLRTTIAKSRAGFVGGAIMLQGSNIAINDSRIVENQLIGTSIWGGAAIYSAPENLGPPRPPVNATGLVQNSVISNNTGGVVLLDYDPGAPINLMQYGSNQIFPNNASVYSNPQAPGVQTIAQLNNLNLHGQPKAPTPNSAPGTAPVVGAIVAVPPLRLPTNAVGDATPPTTSYVGVAWSGGSATLNGGALAGNLGFTSAGPGTHTLAVGASTFTDTIANGAAPLTALNVNPAQVASGGSTQLSWTTIAGAFLTEFIDQGVVLAEPPPAAGSVTVSSILATRQFRGLLVAQEGGSIGYATVSVGSDAIFSDDFE